MTIQIKVHAIGIDQFLETFINAFLSLSMTFSSLCVADQHRGCGLIYVFWETVVFRKVLGNSCSKLNWYFTWFVCRNWGVEVRTLRAGACQTGQDTNIYCNFLLGYGCHGVARLTLAWLSSPKPKNSSCFPLSHIAQRRYAFLMCNQTHELHLCSSSLCSFFFLVKSKTKKQTKTFYSQI